MKLLFWSWWLIIAVALAYLFTGCSKTVYVPVETTRTVLDTDSVDRLIQTMLLHSLKERETETVIVTVSKTVTVNEDGDTLSKETERTTDRLKVTESREAMLLATIDSLQKVKNRVDSVDRAVPYPVEVVKEVNRLSWWQETLAWVGAVALLITMILILLKIKK